MTYKETENFISRASGRVGQALLIATSPGSGKTRAVGEVLQKEQVSARVVVGSKRLARELSQSYGYALIEGRNEQNCHRFEVVQALSQAGHDVGQLACGTERSPRCPFFESCVYRRQFKAPGNRVGTAEQLFNPKFLKDGQLLVVDDADLSRSMVERRRLSADSLRRSIDQLGEEGVAGRDLLAVLVHALVDAPRYPGGQAAVLLGTAVWDHLARTARRYGHDIAALVQSLPSRPPLHQPEGADGVITVEDVGKVPPATLGLLFQSLKEELSAFLTGEDFNSRLRLDRDGVDIWRLREHVADGNGKVLIERLALLVLDATPVDTLVNHLARYHTRLPDVRASVRLPENVRVVQYASSSNGHSVLREQKRIDGVAGEVAAERERFPCTASDREAAICFARHRNHMLRLGFAESQVLTFGSARGSNALAAVERLHVVGRPMPPGDDLVYLAQVLHHEEKAVSGQIKVKTRPYGGQEYQTDVVDFEDRRVSELLRAGREDEIIQAIHRARLVALDLQGSLDDMGSDANRRRQVRLLLHTSHPIPGLRVDELCMSLPNFRRCRMAIENRNLAVGTKLTAKYKKETYKAEVVQMEEGLKYRLEDGREYKSLSSAGTAVTGGPINGWKFWSVEGEATETETEPAQAQAEKPKRFNGVIKRVANQKGVEEGMVRFFCSACLDSFYSPVGETPTACPKGHDESYGEIQTAEEQTQEAADK